MYNRLVKFQKALKKQNLDGFIVTNPVNIFYLTGFKGISPAEREGILVFSPKATLITAKLYQAEALKLRSPKLKIKIADERNKILDAISKVLKGKTKVGLPADLSTKDLSSVEALAKVGFEEQDLKYLEFKEFKKTLKNTRLVPCKNLVEDLRIIKSPEEIKSIEKAQLISQKAFQYLLKTIKIGSTEAEIADKLSKIIKDLGGQGLAFESIIAAGTNSALPHYKTGNRKIKNGQVLLFDFGAKYQHYCADLSRTVFVGKVNTQKHKVFQLVQKAQKKAIDSISQGIKTADVYQAAYKVFKDSKVNQYFLHGLGHGVGLEIHEAPRLKPNNDAKLLENMVFSVEPGLYFPAWGGVRIEDLVVIKNGRAKVLGKLQEEIIVI